MKSAELKGKWTINKHIYIWFGYFACAAWMALLETTKFPWWCNVPVYAKVLVYAIAHKHKELPSLGLFGYFACWMWKAFVKTSKFPWWCNVSVYANVSNQEEYCNSFGAFWTIHVYLFSCVGALVDRALDSRSKSLVFDSQYWSCVQVFGNFVFHTVLVQAAVRDTWCTDPRLDL